MLIGENVKNANVEINQRIEGTDLYIFSKNSQTGVFTYSRPLHIEESKLVAEVVNASIKDAYANAKGLRQGLTVDEKTAALYNMNTFKGILANRELMKQTRGTLWFPTVQEGLLLHDAKLLPLGELMDFGLAVYSIGNPNKKLSESLVAQARDKNYALPILASFKALDLQSGGEEYGVTPEIVSDAHLTIGADAVELFKKFLNVGKSGVQRLYWNYVVDWVAGRDGLDDFYAYCRVGRVSGEANAKNLQALVQFQVEKNFSRRRRELEQQLQEVSVNENDCIKSAETILDR